MEATPKVHKQRPRRTEPRPRRHERQTSNNGNAAQTNTNTNTNTPTTTPQEQASPPTTGIVAAEEGCAALNETLITHHRHHRTGMTRLSQENERQSSADSIEMVGSPSQTSQQTVVLVNGHAPPTQETPQQQEPTPHEDATAADVQTADAASADTASGKAHLESPTQPTKVSDGSRNSSGDAMSLRETLQQLPATITGAHHHRHHHHSRRTHSPQSPATRALEADSSFHRGILGYMDRELKQCSPTPSALSVGAGSSGGGGGGSGAAASGGGASRKMQSLSDPQASPAQRSLRSRGSLEKSPRRKRSKSESRRRRERKLIAAGEMEVRQANETLMRYLKQCSEMNDASLSGELEIDQNYDERRVHRKTKSQRDKRGHLLSKLYSAGGLSSILRELTDDIAPADGEEIYNPFTPVVSPTDDTPAHIDKMFLQTSSGYRPVEHCYYKRSFMGTGRAGGSFSAAAAAAASGRGSGDGGEEGAGILSGARLLRGAGGGGSYGDTRCLLDSDYNRPEITSNIQLSCVIQRIWLLISNICHGLLAGLALAHLLFVMSSHPMDWSKVIKDMSLAGETIITIKSTNITTSSTTTTTTATLTTTTTTAAATTTAATPTITTTPDDLNIEEYANKNLITTTLIGDYASFAEIYLNTFYCLAIICLVSVFDRMDICRWSFSNASELISFRWLIITMIYIATIILTICSDSIDEKLYLFNNNANITLTQQEMLSNSIQSVWSSLSVTRSIAAICGWIMIGLTPNEDLLYEHLVDLTKYQLTNN